MARPELADGPEEGVRAVGPRGTGQAGGDHGLVELAGDAGRREHGVEVAGEDDAVRGQGVVEGPGPDVVAGAEQRPGLRVPHREGVVAEQMVGAAPAPALVGAQDERAVGRARPPRVRHVEGVAQGRAIVETGACGNGEAGAPVDERHLPLRRPVRPRVAPPPESDGAVPPRLAGVAGAARQGRQQGVEARRPGRRARQDAADHECPLPTVRPCRSGGTAGRPRSR